MRAVRDQRSVSPLALGSSLATAAAQARSQHDLVGCVAIAALPQLLDRLGATPIVLLGLGALLYCLGAGVYAFKRPDPWPSTFGFHEVFHSLVILAAASHFVAMAGWIIPNAG